MIHLYKITAACILGTLISSCAPPPKKPAPDATGGLTEAQTLYAKAYVLWRHSHNCSDPEKAIAALNSALELEPNHYKALILRGRAYTQLGMTETAFDDFSHSIRISPTADAYAGRAYTLICENNVRGARRDLDRSFDLDGDSKEAWGVEGVWQLHGNNEKKACEAFKRADTLGDSHWLNSIRTDGLCLK